jgi:hypothetical protein
MCGGIGDIGGAVCAKTGGQFPWIWPTKRNEINAIVRETMGAPAQGNLAYVRSKKGHRRVLQIFLMINYVLRFYDMFWENAGKYNFASIEHLLFH